MPMEFIVLRNSARLRVFFPLFAAAAAFFVLLAVPFGAANAQLVTAGFSAVFLSPVDGQEVSGNVELKAGTEGDAQKVEFHIVDQVGNDPAETLAARVDATGLSWSAFWDTNLSSDGSKEVTMRAYGLTGELIEQVHILHVFNGTTTTVGDETVVQALAVRMGSPASGSTLSQLVDLRATTNVPAQAVEFVISPESGGTVQPIRLQAAGNSTGTEWNAVWNTQDHGNGGYSIMATATDGISSAASDSVSVTVQNETVVQPTLAITQPVANTAVKGTITLSASSTGTVTNVKFEIFSSNNTVVAELNATADTTGGAWTASWNTAAVANGTYTFRAIGSTDSGATITSADVAVSVENETVVQPPQVVFLAPIAGAALVGTVTFSATSSAPLQELSFYVASDTSVSSGPIRVPATGSTDGTRWEASWNSSSAPNGTYAVRARSEQFGTTVLGGPVSVSIVNSTISVQMVSPQSDSTLSGGVKLSLAAIPDADSAAFIFRQNDQDVHSVSARFQSGASTWEADVDTTALADGDYQIVGQASRLGNVFRSSAVQVKVQNGQATSSPQEAVAAIVLVEPAAGSVLSGDARLAASSSVALASLDFFVSGIDNTAFLRKFGATYDPTTAAWQAVVGTQDIANGAYAVVAAARTGDGNELGSARIEVKVQNEEKPAEQPAETLPGPVSIRLVRPSGGPVQGAVALGAVTEGTVTAVAFVVRQAGAERLRIPAEFRDGEWRAPLDTSKLVAGTYALLALANPGTTPVASNSVDVSVPTATTAPAAGEPTAPATSPPAAETAPAAPTTDSKPAAALGVAVLEPGEGATVRGTVKLVARTTAPASRAVFLVRRRNDAQWAFLREAAFIASAGAWGSVWDTTNSSAGEFQIMAVALRRPAALTGSALQQGVWAAIAATGPSGAPTGTEAAGASAPITVRLDNITKPTGLAVSVIETAVVKEFIKEVPAGTTLTTDRSSTSFPEPVLTVEVKEQVRQNVNAECAEKGIAASKCEEWLSVRHQALECKVLGIVTKEECIAYLKAQNRGRLLGCDGRSATECAAVEERATSGLLTAEKFAKVEEQAIKQINKVLRIEAGTVSDPGRPTMITAAPVGEPQEEVGTELKESIPLKPKVEQRLAVRVHASPSYAKVSEDTSVKRVPVVLFIDSDADGLPDDVERKLGTDPANPDTDGDGFSDHTEVKNGFNPLGEGLLGEEKRLAPVEQAIVAGLPIEQPTEAGAVDESLTVETAVTVPKGSAPAEPSEDGQASAPTTEEPVLRLSGKGRSGETVSIFIYSYLPVVLTTAVNDDGNWTYDLEAGLSEGEHQAYVTVTDDTGKIRSRSNPLSFFVSEAQAVTSEADFFQVDTAELAQAPVTRLFWWYAIGVALLIVVAIVLGFMIFMKPRKADDGGFTMS